MKVSTTIIHVCSILRKGITRHFKLLTILGRGKAMALAIAGVGLLSCTEQRGMLPPSGGKLYEVLVVGDKDGIVRKALSQDTPGLPQSEPFFDVSSIDSSKFGPAVSMARNIVNVHVNPQLYTSVRLKYEKNVWAHPQMVVNVNTPSVKMLRDSMQRIAPTLLRLLNRSEINKNLTMLRSKRNTKMEKLVRQMFGIDIWIPMEMSSSKKGNNFLWLSNNSPTIMKNIVIYNSGNSVRNTEPEATLSFCNIRDSVLGLNIKGETNAMQMHTVRQTVTHGTVLYRGLWEMTNDDMGGPFVSRTIADKGKNFTIEGFVFAPGKNKRNAIRQLEATLYTAKDTH